MTLSERIETIKLHSFAGWPHGYCTRLWSEWSGFEPWPGTFRRILGQDTLLSQCLSPPRECINGYRQIFGENVTNCGGVTGDGLASRPGEVEILLASSCYRIRDRLRQQLASLSSKASHVFLNCNARTTCGG